MQPSPRRQGHGATSRGTRGPKSEPMRGVRELSLAEGQYLVGRDREHECSPMATRLQEAVLAHREPPASVPFRHPGLGEATERVVIGDLDRLALDHDIQAAVPGVAAGGEDNVTMVLQVQSLLLLRTRAVVLPVLGP